MASERSKRQSNIELLRIVAACGVIILHYNNPLIGGGYGAVEDGSINQAIMTFFETVFICAVNLYVLISGYFMRNSTKRLKKYRFMPVYLPKIKFALLKHGRERATLFQ